MRNKIWLLNQRKRGVKSWGGKVKKIKKSSEISLLLFC